MNRFAYRWTACVVLVAFLALCLPVGAAQADDRRDRNVESSVFGFHAGQLMALAAVALILVLIGSPPNESETAQAPLPATTAEKQKDLRIAQFGVATPGADPSRLAQAAVPELVKMSLDGAPGAAPRPSSPQVTPIAEARPVLAPANADLVDPIRAALNGYSDDVPSAVLASGIASVFGERTPSQRPV